MNASRMIFGDTPPAGAIVALLGEDRAAISSALVAATRDGHARDCVVDYTLDLLPPFARIRERLRLLEARRRGAAVLVATYREDLIEAIADEVWWIENGGVRLRGDPLDVLRQWREHALRRWRASSMPVPMSPAIRAGDGRARIRAVDLHDSGDAAVGGWKSGEEAAIRIEVEFADAVADPVVGILIRTRIGLSVYGTNTQLEGEALGPRAAGEVLRLSFRFRCDLCPGEYTLTVASHDPDGVWHEWLDDVVPFTVGDSRYTAGVANLRAQVSWELRDN